LGIRFGLQQKRLVAHRAHLVDQAREAYKAKKVAEKAGGSSCEYPQKAVDGREHAGMKGAFACALAGMEGLAIDCGEAEHYRRLDHGETEKKTACSRWTMQMPFYSTSRVYERRPCCSTNTPDLQNAPFMKDRCYAYESRMSANRSDHRPRGPKIRLGKADRVLDQIIIGSVNMHTSGADICTRRSSRSKASWLPLPCSDLGMHTSVTGAMPREN
jgi:hypothetical protein